MMPALTDTHCHLNSPHFAGRVEDVLLRAQGVGVQAIVVPGWDHTSSLQAAAMSAYSGIYPAVGLHPWYVARDARLDWLPGLLEDSHIVAIGEIGIDGAIDGFDPVQQETIFRAQLQLAREHNLPVLIHCRRGWDRLLTCLKETPGVRGVMHAFSGSGEVLRECLKLGFYISFAGMVTRPNSRRAHEAAIHVPTDRLLLETDAPFMALDGIPAEQAEPVHLPHVLTYVAQLRGEDPLTLAEQIAQNAQSLFGIAML